MRGLVGLAQSVGGGVALRGVAVPRDRAPRRRVPLSTWHWRGAVVAACAGAVPTAGCGGEGSSDQRRAYPLTSTTLADFSQARDSQITFSVTHGWSAFW